MGAGRMGRIRPEPVAVHEDGRGRLVKAFSTEITAAAGARGEVYFVTFAPGAVRGGHYHVTAREWFVPARGRIRCELVDPETGERGEYLLDADRPALLAVPPGTAHRFQAVSEGAVLVAFSDLTFDPEAEDTVPYPFPDP